MTQQVLQYFVSALAISQLLFIGACYLFHYEQQALSRLVALFSICVTSYIILVMPVTQSAPLPFQQIFRMLAISALFLLWMISHRLFSNSLATPAWAWLVLLTYTTLRLLGSSDEVIGHELQGLSLVVFNYLPQTIMLAFCAHAMVLALQAVSNERAEPAHNLPVAFVLTMGLLISLIVASGFLASLPGIVHIYAISVIFVHALFFNMFIFRLQETSTHLTTTRERLSRANIRTFYSRADKTFYEQLNATLETDLLYASADLTIKTLADTMQVREYMLRRFINQKLGYRNFNQFLNEFRVGKAIDILKESGESSAKISSIALDVGYAS